MKKALCTLVTRTLLAGAGASPVLAGQTSSLFMDINVFPISGRALFCAYRITVAGLI